MKVEQIYTNCLAQGTYYIQSCDEAIIIDPLREVNPYIEKAAKDGVKIKYIFETHFHADFVSGHLELAEKTGATIVYGPNAVTSFQKYEAKDDEVFEVGDLKIKAIHTPGHTLESTSYLLYDKEGKEYALFTGDTLFIGDVGRPDLAQKGALTQEDLAGILFDSIRTKILPLPDHVIIYPAHGAGSACGKNMSSEKNDTLGNQKKYNYALKADMTKEKFVKELTANLLPPPSYFAQNVALNKEGASSLDFVFEQANTPLSPTAFEVLANESCLVLDTRNQQDFAKEHIPNAVFIGINGAFAPWVGALVTDLSQKIIFIADEGKETEVITRLARVGYDNTLGFLKGGMDAWKAANKPTETIHSIDVFTFERNYYSDSTKILDVRKPNEFAAEHLETAINFPLDFIHQNMSEINREQTYFIHCAGGYRSMIAASILKARGAKHITDIQGGFKLLKETSIPKTMFVCPSSLKA